MANPDLRQADETVGYHFQLECYVGPGGDIRPSPFEGWATFPQIFSRRPDKFRFAVARMVPLKRVTISAQRDVVEAGDAPDGDWLVWDLLADDITNGRGLRSRGILGTPAPLWQGEHLDGLVMKCVALYDQ